MVNVSLQILILIPLLHSAHFNMYIQYVCQAKLLLDYWYLSVAIAMPCTCDHSHYAFHYNQCGFNFVVSNYQYYIIPIKIRALKIPAVQQLINNIADTNHHKAI